MSDQIQLKTYFKESKFDRLKEILNEYDRSDKYSNSHYVRIALNFALEKLEKQRKKERMKAREFRKLKNEIEGILNE
ncbi:MAG: hypothetical protein ACLFUH_04005 [Bacteroidales bacterium]